jgi:hypothetical protein
VKAYRLLEAEQPPMLVEGLTEDKADVNARVAWSGVGIDLATNHPSPQMLREAIRTVLDKKDYRSRASMMAKEFAAIDTRSEILRIIGRGARYGVAKISNLTFVLDEMKRLCRPACASKVRKCWVCRLVRSCE